jgi:hypothetical protein
MLEVILKILHYSESHVNQISVYEVIHMQQICIITFFEFLTLFERL